MTTQALQMWSHTNLLELQQFVWMTMQAGWTNENNVKKQKHPHQCQTTTTTCGMWKTKKHEHEHEHNHSWNYTMSVWMTTQALQMWWHTNLLELQSCWNF